LPQSSLKLMTKRAVLQVNQTYRRQGVDAVEQWLTT
jgi:hypothetical protein